jgi:hypothetical protein
MADFWCPVSGEISGDENCLECMGHPCHAYAVILLANALEITASKFGKAEH